MSEIEEEVPRRSANDSPINAIGSDQEDLERRLFEAAGEDQDQNIHSLILQNVNINARNSLRETPLHLAARCGCNKVVKALLDHLLDINATDNDGWTALYGAARIGNIDIVTLLLRPGPINSAADPNIPDTGGWTPLIAASGEGYLSIVEILLDSGAKIDHEDKNRQTALQNASRWGHLSTVEKLLRSGAFVDHVDHDGWTALQYASTSGHAAVVERLLESNADIDHVSNEGWTALHKACEDGDEDVANMLLKNGASFEKARSDGMKALHIAASEGHLQLVRQLLQKEANQNATTTKKDTPLHLAASNGKAEVVKLLLETLNGSLKSALKAKNADQETAWSIAIKQKDKGVVQEFLKYSADINFDVADNKETLIWAAKQKDTYELVSFVLKKKNRKVGNEVDNQLQELGQRESWEPLHWAVYHGDYSLVWLLLRSNGTDEKAEKVRTSAKIMANTIHKDIKKSHPLRGPSENKKQKESAAQDSKSKDGGPEEKKAKDPKTQDKAQKDPGAEEKKYSEILGILTYPDVLYDPDIVESSDSNKPYKKPSLGAISSDDIASFHVGILDFYQKDERCGLLRRSRDVQTVIYTDGPESIMESARNALKDVEPETAYHDNDLKLRWIHIPANNMRWMTDLVSRIYADSEKRPANEFHEMERFLKKSWRQLPSTDPEKRCMRPACTTFEHSISGTPESDTSSTSSSRSVSIKTTPESTRNDMYKLALYMPYLTFSTLTDEEFNTSPAKQMSSSRTESNKTPETKQLRPKDKEPSQNLQQIMEQNRAQQQTNPEDGSKTAKHQEGDLRTDEKLPINQPLEPLGLYPVRQNEAYRRLLETYIREQQIIHGSRTLDEAHYHSLADQAVVDDLNARNKDQVVSKRVSLVENNKQKPWTILRVDQLWLWVIDEQTVVSCSTHRKDERKDPVLERIWEHLSEEMRRGAIHLQTLSSHEMAKFITEFCIDFFNHATCPVGGIDESIHQIFENSINRMARDEAQLFDKFTNKIDSSIKSAKGKIMTLTGKATDEKEAAGNPKEKKGNKKEGSEDKHSAKHANKESIEKAKKDEAMLQERTNLESIKHASNLLKEIKDIRDELHILKAILTQQKKVWIELRGDQAQEHKGKGPTYIIHDIEEMDKHANRIQEAVKSILDLEQNEASISEAISSREQAQESIQQGRTLMLFTVVTTVFLPLSFLASLFALNISCFPRSDGNVLYSPGWIFPIIFGVTTVISVPLVLLAYIDAVRRHFFIWRENMRDNIGKMSLQKAISTLQAQLKKLSQIKQTTNGNDDDKEANRGTPSNTVPLSAALKFEYHRIKAKRPLFRRKRIEAESDSTIPVSPGEGKATRLDV